MAAVHAATPSAWGARRRRVFESVFQTEPALPQSKSPLVDAAVSLSTPGHFSPAASNLPPIFAQPHGHPGNAPAPASWTTHHHDHDHDHHAQLERAWSVATERLQLPPFTLGHDPEQDALLPPFSCLDEQSNFNAALLLLLQRPHRLQSDQATVSAFDLLSWYHHQVHCHFVQHVLPSMADLSKSRASASGPEHNAYDECMAIICTAVKALRTATNQYIARLTVIVSASHAGSLPEEADHIAKEVMARFTRDLRALITNSFDTISKPLTTILTFRVEEALRVPHSRAAARPISPETTLLGLVEVLEEAGIAGERLQVLFAEIMDRTMTKYIHHSYARVWKHSTTPTIGSVNRHNANSLHPGHASWCIASLYDWIEKDFGRIVLLFLSRVETSKPKPDIVSLADIQQWKEIGNGRLAALRISELFDIVLQWPTSKGALDDLKASVTSPQRRWELTTAFSAALQKRLLHPARSTLDILRFYVSMIRTFHALDHSKVLLSRVVPPLQLYLVQREDAVRIVVKGLLASPDEVERAQKASSSPDGIDAEGSSRGVSGKLLELAILLNDPDQERRMNLDEEDLDWNDMEWVPDPVDAGVNYKRPRSEDVIGTLINTLGSQDVFIKEFQSIISEHLLSTQTDFAQEEKLLALLKRRFGEAAVQTCEVMIKDIYDSRKIDARIWKTKLGQSTQRPRLFGTPAAPPASMDMGKQWDAEEEMGGQVPYHARILSRLYWPDLAQETFQLPPSVAEVQKNYEYGYERLKSARKLTWLHQLGQATVELDLEDRTLQVDCKTFEAAVIYAFQNDQDAQDSGNSPLHMSVPHLQEKLAMDEELVLQAVAFWVSEGVLVRYSTDPDTYTVLERKDSPPSRPELHPSMSAPAALEGEHDFAGMPPKPAGVKRAGTTSAMDAKENERRAVYWQFIVGMLTNSMAAMPLGQMAMMLRMVIPDGLPWSDQELQEFLMEKVALGELETVGGKYRLVKK